MENNPKRNNNTFRRTETKNNMTERVINIAFRIVFHSNVTFFEENIFNNAIIYLFILHKRILTCGISLDSEKLFLSKWG
jgi:hypothetical protein